MGFGVGIGPRLFRVRVGTSGVGVSSGLGPFSVWANTGSGRRRNHVTVRASDVRYLTGSRDPVPPGSPPEVPMADVTGFDANALIATGPGDLVAQLNAAAQMRRWPWALLATVVVACISLSVTWLFALVMLLVGITLTVCVLLLEPPHKVEVSYDVEGPVAGWFSAITAGWSQLVQLGGAWRINTKGAVQTIYQHKTNSGASHLVSRSRVRFGSVGPKMLVTNLPVPSVSSEGQSLHLLPDRVLVKSSRKWSDIDYRHLRVWAEAQPFIEEELVPRDGKQITTTWRYVNVNGGPDRRFKNNRQLPVMLYGRVDLTSDHGLQWLVDLSQPDVAVWFADILERRPSTEAAQ